ncbi:hypothetical protein CTAM01_01890, partial [Colletotrichum tamarilloi]
GVRLDDHRHRTRPNSYSTLPACHLLQGRFLVPILDSRPPCRFHPPPVHLPLLCRPATPASTSQADGLRFRLLAAAAACCLCCSPSV